MIAKEIRALLPAGTAVAATMLVCALVRDLYALSVPAYVIGAAAIGAMAIGREYADRTMPLLLTLPVSRQRVLLTKWFVLGIFLLVLASLAAAALPFRGGGQVRVALIWLPFVAALFITPLLTVAARSAVGGAVFTLGLAGMLTIAGDWIGIWKYGYTAYVDVFRVSFTWNAVLGLSGAAAALMWWAFPRLQTFEGRGDVLDLTPHSRPAAASFTRRNPTWLLIGKELRLQQLPLTIAAIYLVVFVAVVVQTRTMFYRGEAAFLVSMLYAGLLTVVIGSMASAEERHLGTVDAQLLLPVPAARQWLLKILVVFGLTIVLAILLPAAVTAGLQSERIEWGRNVPTVAALTVVSMMALATVSVYVSTLCSSGVWALVVSVPAAFAVAAFVLKLTDINLRVLYSLEGRPHWAVVRWAGAMAAIAVICLVLRFAFANHRSADRSQSRIATQVGIAAAASIAAVLVAGIAGALSR